MWNWILNLHWSLLIAIPYLLLQWIIHQLHLSMDIYGIDIIWNSVNCFIISAMNNSWFLSLGLYHQFITILW
jgi:hypothetical protein